MRTGPSTPSLDDYLTVGAAAELLGVSVATLRRWDRADKFKPLRHPINGYRLYDRGTLLALFSDLRPGDRHDVGATSGPAVGSATGR